MRVAWMMPWRRLLDIGMLYASKTGAIVVGMFILPQFNRLLGAQQFEIVAVVFSFQALLLILDLGLSTLVGRDIAAAAPDDARASGIWKTAETAISVFYLAMIPVALVLREALDLRLSLTELLAVLALFWALTIQNICQAALLARHRFMAAGTIQILGVVLRGGGTLLALHVLGATMTVFLLTQAFCALAQFIAADLMCRRLVGTPGTTARPSAVSRLRDSAALLARGQSLTVFGVAGATVMQLDKVIVSAYSPAESTAAYYLACTLCLTPLSVLAGPVAQFFQPRVVRAISMDDQEGIERALKPFVVCLTLVTLVPSALIWLLRQPLVSAWLSGSAHALEVAHYTSILIPGIAIGALGYVPYAILVARQDYSFQARLSAMLTVLTLCAATVVASKAGVEGVCWVYVVYHSASTLTSWARCISLQRGGPERYATSAATRMVGWAAALAASTLVLSSMVFQFMRP